MWNKKQLIYSKKALTKNKSNVSRETNSGRSFKTVPTDTMKEANGYVRIFCISGRLRCKKILKYPIVILKMREK